MHKRFSILLWLYVLLCITHTSVIASSTGVTGRVATNGTGCGGNDCHGSVSQGTTVSILEAVDGKITMKPGVTVTLTLQVFNPNKTAAGCNIGVKTVKNGFIRAGTLVAISGSGLYLLGSELTHASPKTMTDGSATFEFEWKAPTNQGTYYLQAAANAVNESGTPDGDNWNFMEPVQIVVSTEVGVHSAESPLTSIYPVPAHGNVTITAEAVAGTDVSITIVDALGAVIREWTGQCNNGAFVYVWNGRSQDGSPAPPGVYVVAVQNQRRLIWGRAILAR